MSHVTSLVLGTVNAPYSANLDAHELAACISDISAMNTAIGPVFSFFTEVQSSLQLAFIEEMGVKDGAVSVAKALQAKCGNPIFLAA